VNEKYLAGRGLPQDLSTRAVARSISAEMHSSFLAMRKEIPMNFRRKIPNLQLSTETQQDIERICEIWRTCRTHYGQSGTWLFGEFSVVDAMFAPVACRFDTYGIAVDDIEQAYVNALLQLPALQAWRQSAQQETEVLSTFER
jgi:glutathione S-transferase